MAQTATTPTTAPAAMPAVFGPFDGGGDSAVGTAAGCVWPGAVTTTVLARVIVDGGLSLVVSGWGAAAAAALLEGVGLAAGLGVVAEDVAGGLGEGATFGDVLGWESESESASELFASWALPTLLFSPVNKSDQALSPPPRRRSVGTRFHSV